MDNHPIPQDVTHFQFKLIGEMTIKQFGYVAAGGVLAWISISIPISFYLKILLFPLFAGTGLIFAFVPIEGRAADLMLTYFFKALFKPNQYVFHKQNVFLSFEDFIHAIPTTPAIQTPVRQGIINQPVPAPVAKTAVPSFQSAALLQSSAQPVQQPQAQYPINPPAIIQQKNTPAITISPSVPSLPINDKPSIAMQQRIPAEKIEEKKAETTTIEKEKEQKYLFPTNTTNTANTLSAPGQTNHLENQLQNVLQQKEQLEQQLRTLQQQMQPQTTQEVPQPVLENQNQVKKSVTPKPVSDAPMVSDFANVIIGVVKDSRGNVLPNILIEVKDTDGNPVRAFKTNALGQFASATPLLNGTYSILFEDPAKKHAFQPIQVSVVGEVMQPIQATSIDEREELRKELFG